MHDLVLKSGRVIDPAQGIDRVTDLAFAGGKVVEIGDGLSGRESQDCTGLIVTPGLIDLHTHVYWGGTWLGVAPEAYAAQSAVATLVDTGSAGPGNFPGFQAHVITPCPVRILAYLHISFSGIFGWGPETAVGESEDIRMMAPIGAVKVAKAYPETVIGIKLRLGRHASGDQGLAPLGYALQVADAAGLPLMVHIDEPPPTYAELCDQLRPGDVLTHCFRPFPNSPVGRDGQPLAQALAARDRGVIFDIGHGMGSFAYRTARAMLEAGFPPDVISSDVHEFCIRGPAFDLLTTMSKFLALGMDLNEVIRAATEAPAKALRRPDLGALRPGAPGEASLLALEDGAHALEDATGEVLTAPQRLMARGLVLAGRMWTPGAAAAPG